ncbi:MAG: hypothetical protein HYS25_00990 [Ignavibacteriales bacterium]|nr:hypothetical protein [Ignavibacteriales bacterium]
MIKLNYPYRCRHCGKTYTIIRGRFAWSFLPVEIIQGGEVNDIEFDITKHTSHLKNCTPLQMQWESVKQKIIRQQAKFTEKLLK